MAQALSETEEALVRRIQAMAAGQTDTVMCRVLGTALMRIMVTGQGVEAARGLAHTLTAFTEVLRETMDELDPRH